jgi:hypothetical protein
MATKVENAGGLFDEFKDEMNSFISRGFALIESEQSKVNKALFEALNMAQRDVFCGSLEKQGVKPARIVKITGKSQPTVNRHLNKKNS